MTMTTHAAHKLVVAPRRHLRRGESHADTSTEEEERRSGDKWRYNIMKSCFTDHHQ